MSKHSDQQLLQHPVSNYLPHRPLYAEVDKAGVVYYGNYFIWFEAGRGELLRRFGVTYRQIEDDWGLVLPVTHCEAQYHRSARYDDLLMIETTLVRLTPIRTDFEYRVFNMDELGEPKSEIEFLAQAGKDAKPIVTGKTSHVFVTPEGRILRKGRDLLTIIQRNPLPKNN